MSKCCDNKQTTAPQQDVKLTIALCGNPNSGKTTLFNVLTGSNQKVGNWPGVTVEQKLGTYKQDKTVAIVDTPGIYSLSPFTLDEQVAHNYLMSGAPDIVINIVDSTNLERSLFLTTQLLELGLPVIVALNMQDEAKAKGIYIDIDKLQQYFGCTFVSISAAKKQGIEQLMQICIDQKLSVAKPIRYSAVIEQSISTLQRIAMGKSRWQLIKMIEGDATALKNCTDEQVDTAKKLQTQLQEKINEAVAITISTQRYEQVSKILSSAVKTEDVDPKVQKAQRITQKIDKIVLNKWLAFPIFALVMTLVFYISIGGLGGLLSGLINDNLTPWLQDVVRGWIDNANLPWLTSLIVDGIMAGVLGVVGFVPQIMLLFGFIAILEASGYMSRIAFIMDKLLNSIGLGGKSFVSMIIGCGCSVPAIMATRTIKNVNERNATITLTPFMPCSAKMAIISFFTAELLGGNPFIAVSFYFISIVAVIVGGLIMKIFSRRKTNASDTFIMELPTYRFPTVATVAKQMWERGKAFIIKAGTIIFLASVILWLLKSFNWTFQMVETQYSMIADIGRVFAPLFVPLGFGDWRFAVATITGITAKETVVSTLEILTAGTSIQQLLSPLAAYSFVVYNLLTVPCIATISASFSEQGKWKNGVKSILFQILTAYLVSLAIYQLGTLATKYTTAFIVTVCSIVVAFGIYFSVRYLIKHKGCNYECDHCPHHDACPKEEHNKK